MTFQRNQAAAEGRTPAQPQDADQGGKVALSDKAEVTAIGPWARALQRVIMDIRLWNCG